MKHSIKSIDLNSLAENIKTWSQELGFDDIGISDIDLSEDKKYLKAWLGKKFHAEMLYMEKNFDKRTDPSKLVPKTTRVICLSMNYYPEDFKDIEILHNPYKAYISSYALGRDYHKVLRKNLKKLANKIKQYTNHECRVFTDSAPVMEKALAKKANLGWIGKNTILINKKKGSYFFLGEIYTDLELPVDKRRNSNHCGSCQKCIQVCPTNAFKGPHVLDSAKCISYLTIEYKGIIDEELRPLMGNRIFGCDDCQIFCPWNKFKTPSKNKDFSPRHGLNNVELLELFSWTEEEFLNKTKGSPIRRAGYESWLRNIAIALGNAPKSEKVLNSLKKKATHPSFIVREHVNWAIKQQQL